jgi:hypothetical protein
MTGVDRLGFPHYGPLPGNVPAPPNAWREHRELGVVRELNARTLASPDAQRFTEMLADRGDLELWSEFAKQYRRNTGVLRGLTGSGIMYAAMGGAALRSWVAKHGYDRLRPFEVDPSIRPLGKVPKDPSYPSGHTASAYAAATVLSNLWPARAYEFNWWARQVGLSRIHAGVHFPSDVVMGSQVGRRAGAIASSALW